jgi:hypothetical protein
MADPVHLSWLLDSRMHMDASHTDGCTVYTQGFSVSLSICFRVDHAKVDHAKDVYVRLAKYMFQDLQYTAITA